MPYLLITTQIRLEAGPCIVGDEESDPELMQYLGAELRQENGQFFKVGLIWYIPLYSSLLSSGVGDSPPTQASS